jgi:hypothetical protein
MASRFWVGGTGTWDGSDTTHWAATSGGAGGQSVPGSGDTVTLDGSSGGGTVTVNTNFTIQTLTMGAFTGTLNFNTNNNSPTINFGGLLATGTGARTLDMGSGTWTFTQATGTLMDFTTTTNLTFVGSNASVSIVNTAPSGRRALIIKNFTFGAWTIGGTTAPAHPVYFDHTGATLASLAISGAANLVLANGTTLTLSAAPTWNGGSLTTPVFVTNNFSAFSDAQATIAVSSGAPAVNFVALYGIVFSGSTGTAASSVNLGRNSGITITAPTAGVASVIGS